MSPETTLTRHSPGLADRDLEQTLARRAVAGDQGAWEQIVNQEAPRILSFFRRVTANQTEAEDLTQETFLQAWRSLAGFRGDAKLSTWLYKIAISRHHRWSRRAWFRASIRWLSADQVETPALGPDIGMDRDAQQAALHRALATLSTEMREVVVLVELEERTYAETQAILGLKPGTLASRLARARLALRAALEQTGWRPEETTP